MANPSVCPWIPGRASVPSISPPASPASLRAQKRAKNCSTTIIIVSRRTHQVGREHDCLEQPRAGNAHAAAVRATSYLDNCSMNSLAFGGAHASMCKKSSPSSGPHPLGPASWTQPPLPMTPRAPEAPPQAFFCGAPPPPPTPFHPPSRGCQLGAEL